MTNIREKKKSFSHSYPLSIVRGSAELTIVASCFWLATFLILPMIAFEKTDNHEEVEKLQEDTS